MLATRRSRHTAKELQILPTHWQTQKFATHLLLADPQK